MGRETKIPWCHHTFNGVRGCEHAVLADGTESPGCEHCYAESMSKRNPRYLGEWGPEGTRVLGGPDYWANLDRWHRAAVADGELRRVFCYSLGDVFESPRSVANADVCAKGRGLLFDAVERLPPLHVPQTDVTAILAGQRPMYRQGGLIFLVLTKRPENVQRMVPDEWLDSWPQHVWLGTSVENQQAADERIPHLLAMPGVPVRFLSIEPLLERVHLTAYLAGRAVDRALAHHASTGHPCSGFATEADCEVCRIGFGPEEPTVKWLIVGGESGHHARACDIAWIRDLRDQAKAAGVRFFNKQLGARPYSATGAPVPLRHPKGEDPEEWSVDLRVREVPQ
jgi:protein gp37